MIINGRIVGYGRVDFSRRVIRRGLRRLAAPIVRKIREMIGSRRVSSPGGIPGRDTGALFRAVKAKTSRAGFSVAIAPFRTPALMRKGADTYYPAFLLFGADRGGRGGKLEPRQNYIVSVVESHEGAVRDGLTALLPEALAPRKIA